MYTIVQSIRLIYTIIKKSHSFDSKITWFEILQGVCANVKMIIHIIMPAYILNLITDKVAWTTILYTIFFYGISVSLLGCGEKSFKLMQEAHGFRACNLFRLSMNQKYMLLDYQDTERAVVIDKFEQAKKAMWEFTDVGYVIFNDILGNFLTFITMTYIIMRIDALVFVVIFALVCLTVWIGHLKNEVVHKSEQEENKCMRNIDYTVKQMQGFEAGKEVRLYNLSLFFKNKHREQTQNYRNLVNNRENKLLVFSIYQVLINLVQLLIIYGIAFQKYIVGYLPIGSFLLFISAIKGLYSSVENLLAAGIELYRASAYYKDYQSFMDIPEKLRLTKGNILESEVLHFELLDVSYCYAESRVNSIHHVSLAFSSGETIAIVGENGSGKSTLIKLLLRLYDPTEGSIRLNGMDIKYIEYEEYLRLFSTVFQDFTLFAYSILENITFDKAINTQKLLSILNHIGLTERFEKLSKGIHSSVTKTLEDDGINLSGGERQLIAFARANYKDAIVGIFDEPTAALDPLKEEHIYLLMKEINIQNKIAIFCSHRMSSTRFCDKIVVLDRGKLVEIGSHSELMSSTGVYRNMYTKQASLYRKSDEERLV